MRLARARPGGGHHGGRDGADASERPAPRYPGAVWSPCFGAHGLGRWLDHTPIARNGRCNSRDALTASRYARRAAQPLAPGAGDTHRIAIPGARGPGVETAGSSTSVERRPRARRTVNLAPSAARSPRYSDRVGSGVVRRQSSRTRPDLAPTAPPTAAPRLSQCVGHSRWQRRSGPALAFGARDGGRSRRRTIHLASSPTRDGTGRPARPDASTSPHGGRPSRRAPYRPR
jgi:hypothetical protein